jgi:hypothetical protein
MICNFYYAPLKDCMNPYCYYPQSKEIDCPVKKEYSASTAQLKMPEARQQTRRE